MIPPAPLEVHVWSASRDAGEAEVESHRALLTAEERARADRFVRPEDRRRFAIGRGTLRRILGGYLGRDPASLRFAHNPHGKPGLEGTSLRFNLSHSGSLMLVAVADGRELGVDIEQVRPEFGGEAIARRFFAPAEVEALLALPAADRTLAFFRGWSRKEAYIKAVGKGLAMPLDQFEVEIRPDRPAALLATRPDSAEAGRWTLVELPAEPGYAAALCAAGRGWAVRQADWDDAGAG